MSSVSKHLPMKSLEIKENFTQWTFKKTRLTPYFLLQFTSSFHLTGTAPIIFSDRKSRSTLWRLKAPPSPRGRGPSTHRTPKPIRFTCLPWRLYLTASFHRKRSELLPSHTRDGETLRKVKGRPVASSEVA